MCSVVAETQTATELIVELGYDGLTEPQRSQRHWEAMAYALFSRHAQAHSSVTSVVITGFAMTTADASAF